MKKKMNLPNKLTVLRMCLVPVILLFGMFTPSYEETPWFFISCFICAVLFAGAAFTDMLDRRIARKKGLVTDFGKFMDPVADKFMVISALFVLLYKFPNLKILMIIALIVVVFRELAVTSMRLVVSSGKKIVIAANMLGKIKTVSQIGAICIAFIEPIIYHLIKVIFEVEFNSDIVPITWALMIFSLVMTVWSGANYIMAYWKYIDTDK
jgi:CDP-diacylglycerol--glycerol-3-phosphate 3-phosphatidyltransferase